MIRIKQKIISHIDIIIKIELIILVSVLLILIKGYSYPYYAGLIPSMQHISDPTMFQNDWHIESLTLYHYQFKIFFIFLSKLTNISILNLFFIGYLLTMVLFVFSIYKLSLTLFQDKTIFFIFFALFLIFPTNGIETNHLLQNNLFQPILFATPFAILAINYLIKNKNILAYLFIGIVTFIHITVGMGLFFVFFCFNILNNIKQLNIIFYKKMFFSIFTYLTVSGYILSIAIYNFWQNITPETNNNLVTIIDNLRFRAPQHYFLSISPEYLIIFLIIILPVGVVGFWQKSKKKLSVKDKKVALFVGVIFTFSLIAFIFIEIIPIDLIASFQFYRLTIFVTLFALLYLSYSVVYFFNIVLKFKKNYIIIVAIFAFFIPVKIDGFGKFNIKLNYNTELRQLHYWIRYNTPVSSFFVHPPQLNGFNLYSQRKELVNSFDNPLYSRKDLTEWKNRLEDITKIENIFDISSVSFRPILAEKYNELNETDFQYLKNKYGIDYAVTLNNNLNFNKVHQTKHFSVYKIE